MVYFHELSVLSWWYYKYHSVHHFYTTKTVFTILCTSILSSNPPPTPMLPLIIDTLCRPWQCTLNCGVLSVVHFAANLNLIFILDRDMIGRITTGSALSLQLFKWFSSGNLNPTIKHNFSEGFLLTVGILSTYDLVHSHISNNKKGFFGIIFWN